MDKFVAAEGWAPHQLLPSLREAQLREGLDPIAVSMEHTDPGLVQVGVLQGTEETRLTSRRRKGLKGGWRQGRKRGGK